MHARHIYCSFNSIFHTTPRICNCVNVKFVTSMIKTLFYESESIWHDSSDCVRFVTGDNFDGSGESRNYSSSFFTGLNVFVCSQYNWLDCFCLHWTMVWNALHIGTLTYWNSFNGFLWINSCFKRYFLFIKNKRWFIGMRIKALGK